MDRYCSIDGIVLKEADFGESSKMLTVFSGEQGIVRVCAKGVRKPNSKVRSAAQIFCYSHLELYKRQGEVYTLTGANIIHAFYGISENLDTYYAAGYMFRILLKVLQPELPDPDTLRLLLNCLYYLETGKRSPRYIQVLFILRLLSIQGFMPDVTQLAARNKRVLQPGTLRALQHITESDMEFLFKFSVSDTILEELESVSADLESACL